MDARKPTALVVGASGLVGRRLMRRLGDAACGTYSTNAAPGLVHLDVTNAAEARSVVERVQPSVVVHCAAWTHVDGCEGDPARSYAVNVEGVRNVAVAAAAAGARFLFYSTDYVFGGDNGPHRLDEPTAPMNVYGRHKLEAERVIASALADHVVIRTCNVYAYEPGGKNFVMAVLDAARAGRRMRIPSDQWGNPTLADDLAEATVLLARSELRGTLHLAGPDFVDRPTWARQTARALGLDAGMFDAVPTSAIAPPAARPLRAGLVSAECQRRVGYRFRDLLDGLAAVAAAASEDRAYST